MADSYTYLDCNGRNVGPIGKLTGEVIIPASTTTTTFVEAQPCSQCADPRLKGIHTCWRKNIKPPKNKKLKPLEKWNEEVRRRRAKAEADEEKKRLQGNGLACPNCGGALVDSQLGCFESRGWSSMTTRVACSSCQFESEREC